MTTPRSHDEPPSDLPAGIGNPARRALAAAGFTRLEQLSDVTEAQVDALHGVGPKAVSVLRAALHEKGLSFEQP